VKTGSGPDYDFIAALVYKFPEDSMHACQRKTYDTREQAERLGEACVRGLEMRGQSMAALVFQNKRKRWKLSLIPACEA